MTEELRRFDQVLLGLPRDTSLICSNAGISSLTFSGSLNFSTSFTVIEARKKTGTRNYITKCGKTGTGSLLGATAERNLVGAITSQAASPSWLDFRVELPRCPTPLGFRRDADWSCWR